MNILKDQFSDCVIGHSDHTIVIKVPLYAVAMGARILEKHYKIDEDMDCVDKTVFVQCSTPTKDGKTQKYFWEIRISDNSPEQ